jgi:hypothetical protein
MADRVDACVVGDQAARFDPMRDRTPVLTQSEQLLSRHIATLPPGQRGYLSISVLIFAHTVCLFHHPHLRGPSYSFCPPSPTK